MNDRIFSKLKGCGREKQKAFSLNEFGSIKAESLFIAYFRAIAFVRVGKPGCFQPGLIW
jgi:hypothetical protein